MGCLIVITSHYPDLVNEPFSVSCGHTGFLRGDDLGILRKPDFEDHDWLALIFIASHYLDLNE